MLTPVTGGTAMLLSLWLFTVTSTALATGPPAKPDRHVETIKCYEEEEPESFAILTLDIENKMAARARYYILAGRFLDLFDHCSWIQEPVRGDKEGVYNPTTYNQTPLTGPLSAF